MRAAAQLLQTLQLVLLSPEDPAALSTGQLLGVAPTPRQLTVPHGMRDGQRLNQLTGYQSAGRMVPILAGIGIQECIRSRGRET